MRKHSATASRPQSLRPHAPAHLQLANPKLSRPTRGDLRGAEKASLLRTAAHQLADKNEFDAGEVGHLSTAQQRWTRQQIISATRVVGNKPDGRERPREDLSPASSGLVYMDPLTWRWGPVSFARLIRLLTYKYPGSLLSNRAEPAASWAHLLVTLTRLATSAGNGTADSRSQT
jgi:hypothetical protein